MRRHFVFEESLQQQCEFETNKAEGKKKTSKAGGMRNWDKEAGQEAVAVTYVRSDSRGIQKAKSISLVTNWRQLSSNFVGVIPVSSTKAETR